MTFNSFSYFLFLPTVFLVFQFTKDRFRWLVLLASSYIFYGFLLRPSLLAVLAFVTIFSYWVGSLIGQTKSQKRRKTLLCIGVSVNLLVLVYFKYLVFLVENLNMLLDLLSFENTIPQPEPLVSVALSFFIFQAISFLADMYFGTIRPELHPGHFALYISFFPKLLQGPIERTGNFLPQIKKPYQFKYDEVRQGLLLFSWGLFLKTVVADRFALFVDPVYNNVQAYTGITLIIATYAYAFQIYFDFAGYTNMALGSARLFGITLTQNFNSPYLATSCADFWRGWHISFSRWILDYIFEPLQMKWRNLAKTGTALALFVTFLLSGIWHGASWNFLIWGVLHGIFLAISIYYRPYKKKIHKRLVPEKNRWARAVPILITFHLVCLTYIFFRSTTVSDAWYIVTNMLDIHGNYASIQGNGMSEFIKSDILIGQKKTVALTLAVMSSIPLTVRRFRNMPFFEKPVWFRWTCYYGLFLLITVFHLSTKPSFIYFQF